MQAHTKGTIVVTIIIQSVAPAQARDHAQKTTPAHLDTHGTGLCVYPLIQSVQTAAPMTLLLACVI